VITRGGVRARLLLRQVRTSVLFMLAWFSLGTAGFEVFDHLPFGPALLNALFLGRQRGWFWDLYSWWGQCVLFGITVSVFLMKSVLEHNPLEACRMLARDMKEHVIVVGYTHFGKRIVDHLRDCGRPWVLIERDATAVDHLVRAGDPVIVDNAKETSTLADAGIQHAHMLIVASDNIETALLVTKRAREANREARIVVRCFQDDFAEILEGLGANEVISASKSAFREVSGWLPAEKP
jgi:hypothetical protein